MAVILGVDPSLTSTGIARVDTEDRLAPETWTITSTGHKGDTLAQRCDRLTAIADEIALYECDIVVIEAPSLGQARQGGTLDRNGLWWLIVSRLDRFDHLPVVAVPPASLKRYATGKGNATKEAMVAAAARRLPHVDTGDQADRVDALWLAAMGADAYGCPLVDLPITHRAALDGVVWSGARRSA